MPDVLTQFKAKTRFGRVVAVSSDEIKDTVARGLSESSVVFMDTETGIYEDTPETAIWTKRLRLMQVGFKGSKDVYLVDPQTYPELIIQLMEGTSKIVSHNSAFDISVLAGWRFKDAEDAYSWVENTALEGRAVCTMVYDKIREHRNFNKSLALLAEKAGVHNKWEDRLKERGKELGYDGAEVYEHININDKVYLNYAGHDIFQLRAVYKELKNDGYIGYELCEEETAISLAYHVLMMRGIDVDVDMLEEVMTEKNGLKSEILMKLSKHGITKLMSANEIHESLESCGIDLPERTPKGRKRMNKGVLEGVMAGDNKKAAKIATLVTTGRSYASDYSMLNQIFENLDSENKVHPDLRGIGTKTSRSSCRTPNLQQVNKTTGDPRVRMCLLPRPGEVSASVDFSGVEVRAIADLARDKKLRDRMLEGYDIHGELAASIYGDDYTPRNRARCKNGIFAMLYGASDVSMAGQIGCSVKQAGSLRATFADLYRKVDKASQRWIEDAEIDGFIQLPPPSGWVTSTTEGEGDDDGAAYRAVNYMIQGWASVIVKMSAMQIMRAGLWKYVCMVIHDEFVLSLPKRNAEQIMQKIIDAGRVQTDFMTYDLDGEIYGRSWK